MTIRELLVRDGKWQDTRGPWRGGSQRQLAWCGIDLAVGEQWCAVSCDVLYCPTCDKYTRPTYSHAYHLHKKKDGDIEAHKLASMASAKPLTIPREPNEKGGCDVKILDCECGWYAFVARATDRTYSVMCKDGGSFDHRFGPSKRRKWQAVRAWNKWARRGFKP